MSLRISSSPISPPMSVSALLSSCPEPRTILENETLIRAITTEKISITTINSIMV
ncbi:MAG: hypothetical protein ACD_55C00049G0001 [uncultured bacterium]|nr:MAG: hypothetical protein ACD_55C00049G0001 [uncultured bacterium]